VVLTPLGFSIIISVQMRNTIQKGKFQFLIIGIGEERYIGLCKELGFIEEGKTMEEVEKHLVNSTLLLLKTVKENPEFEESLNLGLPFRYRLLFHTIPLVALIASFSNKLSANIRFFTSDIPSPRYGEAFL